MVSNNEHEVPPVRTLFLMCPTSSSLAIHLFVVGLIITTRDVFKPILIIKIPTYSLFNTFFKLEARLPTEFCLKFARVDGVTGIMAEAVGNVGDEVEVFAFFATKESVNGIDDDLDDVDVLPLVKATDVVSFCYFTLMEDEVDGTGMVFYKEPVAYILSFAIDRQWLSVADIVDKERYQFLRELIRTIVVRAVGNDGWHAVCIVE